MDDVLMYLDGKAFQPSSVAITPAEDTPTLTARLAGRYSGIAGEFEKIVSVDETPFRQAKWYFTLN